MSNWNSAKAKRVLAALERNGWSVKRQKGGSHKVLEHPEYPDFVFSFHEGDEIGPKMMARIAKKTGLKPEDI
jgi:predicted RNA binding protein YcfA (HicA-like mRNA interferase family)